MKQKNPSLHGHNMVCVFMLLSVFQLSNLYFLQLFDSSFLIFFYRFIVFFDFFCLSFPLISTFLKGTFHFSLSVSIIFKKFYFSSFCLALSASGCSVMDGVEPLVSDCAI